MMVALTAPAWSLTLTDALGLARRTDPQFLIAQANLAGAHERVGQAFGALWPQVSISANTTGNRRNYQVLDSSQPPARDHYNSNGAQITVTQPLWRRANRIAIAQADATVLQAEYQFAAAEQDLLVRLAQAWFDVMLSRDVVVFNSGQVAASQNQWEQAKRGAEIGLTSGPALEEARTKYDQALAEHAGADIEQNIKLATLEQIIGPLAQLAPPALSDDHVAKDPRGTSLEQWLSQAETTSPAVLAATRALDAANEEIRKQRAGHEPTLDAVATYGRNSQAVGSFPGQSGSDVKQRTIALQLNIPIFSGGTQNAKVGEAIAMRDKAAQDLEAARRNVRLTAKQAWFTYQAGLVRKTAALQAMKFSSITLHAAIKGKTTGLKMELDVLQARQQLYSAWRDLQKARYDMITSYLKLQSTVGKLADADLAAFDAWFIDGGLQTAEKISSYGR
ncbi:TolC family outer membrane protein [Polaromonas sp. P2-4]|nr:TolC family outer membrane protein [Polaromonas sp. P2-4]